MKKIEEGIIFSYDIKRILEGTNAFNFSYNVDINDDTISALRSDFKKDTSKIFNGKVTIISEEEMLQVSNLIRSDYPHCYTR